jgi:alcohol dehydrogenase (NADP+)
MTVRDTLRYTEIPLGHGSGNLPALGFGTLLPDRSLTGEAIGEHQIAFMAYASLGHGMTPKVTEDPTVIRIAQRVGKSPAQVLLAWGVQRGTAILTSSTNPKFIEQNADIATLPDDAMAEIRDQVTTRARLNAVVETGIPGMIPR